MIRDGDPLPIDKCTRPCRHCPAGTKCLVYQADLEARRNGWLPIQTAQIAIRDNQSDPIANLIEGLTRDGMIVRARYYARGDYQDRWSDEDVNKLYDLTHWRYLSSEAA